MKKLPLGNSGIEVSEFCLGTMRFGSAHDEAISGRMMEMYIEAGGTFLDTSINYAFWVKDCNGGESETFLGKWLKEHGNRDDMFVATKVGFNTPEIGRNLTTDVIVSECEKSLQRLQTDHIDLYYAHCDQCETPLAETLGAFDKQIKDGKVGLIGASNTRAWRLEEARNVSAKNGLAEYCCVQQRHSYLRSNAGVDANVKVEANADLLDYTAARDITLLAYGPSAHGYYTKMDQPLGGSSAGPDSDARIVALKEVVAETGATATQVVYAWMLQGKPPVIPLLACSTEEQMTENLGALSVKLSDGQIERLTKAGV
jgi:aryl-alcohol dehydrogenase-like predicted oxidoreductase